MNAREDGEATVAAVDSLDSMLIAVEEHLFQVKQTGTGQDAVRWPARIVGRLGYLAGAVAVADFPPTDQQREVHQLLQQRLQQSQDAFAAILQTDLPAFNRFLQARNLTSVITEPR